MKSYDSQIKPYINHRKSYEFKAALHRHGRNSKYDKRLKIRPNANDPEKR